MIRPNATRNTTSEAMSTGTQSRWRAARTNDGLAAGGSSWCARSASWLPVSRVEAIAIAARAEAG
jgi:hypothetical protein